MQNEAPPAGPLEGLPVWVSDPEKTWPSLRIAQSVPLGRLEWLWKSRGASIRDSSTSARAVFEISNTFAEPIPELQGLAHEWYRNPYVYILVTTVKELDDAKDVITWERIRLFLDACREELHEYLIVVAASDIEVIHQRRIIEKLRTEVNLVARGRERVVIVPPASIHEEMRPITHLHHSPSHQDLLVRLRECIRDGVEARIRSYEDEVSCSYLSKSASSWLFTKYFALKEGMAFVFVQLGRRDLAVKLYDELYITMIEANYLSDRKFCTLNATEAARGISNPDERKYRALLVDDSATELDMRTYLFARQVSLLLVDRKFSDVAERGLKFITAIARRCVEEALKRNNGVSASFKDTWVFATARALAAALAPAIPSQAEASHALSSQLSTPRERHTARLIAGFHVHALKAFLGLAQVVLPGCLSGDETAIVGDREAIATEVRSTADEKLNNALLDRKKAEMLHSELANAAASLYEMGGRARGAAALDGDAGMVCMRNKSHSEGESLLAAQCSRFSNDNGWDELHRRPRLELLKAEKELDRVQEYLVSCLTMLYMTRESRRLTVPTSACAGPDSVSSKADIWMQETRKTTAKLPRVMKYRADRLFDVYVRPNNVQWDEGDMASATVEIRSDVPVSITVDRVTMDCRCVDIDDRRKSAFHNRSQTSLSSAHLKGNQPANNISSKAVSLSQEKPETLTLRSDEKLTISPGVSLVHVASDEVPRSGLFKVTSIALFMDNLKLVQAAVRVPMHPVVITKNDSAIKAPSPALQPMLLADLANCDVRFPIFVASRRKPSASLFIESRNHLYLAPQSVQYIHLRIQAGSHGIIAGARLSCALLYLGNDPPGPSEALVQFAGRTQSSLDNGDFVLPVASVNDSDETFGSGEAVINRELRPHETLDAKIAVHVSSEVGFVQHQLCHDPDKVSTTLYVQFSCRERDGNRNRVFSCDAQGQLSFFAPLKVSCHTQMYSSWGSDTVQGAVGLDGTPLTDGGSLLCLITSIVSPKDILTLKKVSLETPFWLELRPDESPAHDDLLPTQLGQSMSFTCIFDVLGREQESPRYQGTLSNTPELFEMDAMQRRASRKYESSSDLKNNQTDSQDWKYGPPPDDSSSSEEGLMEQVAFATQNTVIQSGDSDDALTTRDSRNEIANLPVEDIASISVREAEDVVDLFTPGGHSRGLANMEVSSSMVARGYSLPKDIAILRLYVEISGVKGVSCLERKISMEAFRTAKKRYKVERSFDKVGRNGNLMQLRFQVRSAGERRTYYDNSEEETTLQFEVDADPQVWLVVGRRRGKLLVRRGLVTAETVSLIPLACGWHHVPCLRLFTVDGQAMPFSRYEIVDECKDVVILPCTAIVNGCAIDAVDGKSGKLESAKRNMPVVVASDSFFKP